MKLARIEHSRCGEWTSSTYVWVDDGITDEQLQETVDRVAKEYLARVKEVMTTEKPKASPYGQPDWKAEKNLERPVKDVLAEHEKAQAEAHVYAKKRQEAMQSFGTILAKEEGIESFWDREPDISVEADWGHNHGLTIEYGETRIGDFRLLKTVKRQSEGRPVIQLSEEEDWA
jgi:hypothetical protein